MYRDRIREAKGRQIGYPECLHAPELYKDLGQITGRMHALSGEYQPRAGIVPRPHWHQNYYLRSLETYVPPEQSRVYRSCAELMERIGTTLGQTPRNYGLIHGDIGVGNFTVSEKGITLFDFDEAQYSWFLEDIAVPLYYLVYVYGGEEGQGDRESQAERFLTPFLEGCRQHRPLEEEQLRQLPLFLRLREIIAYTGMYRSADFSRLNDWARDYLAQSRVRIEKGQPIVDIGS